MPQGYHHVTRDIRSQIYTLKATGISLRKIAYIVELDASTISREIKRNTSSSGYRFDILTFLKKGDFRDSISQLVLAS